MMRTAHSAVLVLTLLLVGNVSGQNVGTGPIPQPLTSELLTAEPQPSEASASIPSPGDEPPPPPPFAGLLCERSKLTGDWYGLRSELRDHGVTFDVSATQYYQGVTRGGIQDNFQYGGRADYLLNIDGEKAGLWKGLFINLHAETVFGTSVNSDTGALMPVNVGRLLPIPNGEITALTGIKFTQALSENFAVFAGKINTFDGFKQPFMNGTGLDAGFMNLGNIAPPVLFRTLPYSSWGAGGAILVDGQPAASVMVLDTHNTPTTTGFENFFNNGATIFAFGGLPSNFFGKPGVHSIGGTYSSGSYTDISPESYSLLSILSSVIQGLPIAKQVSGSWSAFYQGQQTLWTDPENEKRSWGFFGSAGVSDGNPNPIKWSGNVGIGGTSPIPGRELDTFGASYYYLGLSDNIKNLAPRLLPLRDEQGLELFYKASITPWFQITHDLQFLTPARANLSPVVVAGIRAKIDF